MYDRHALINGVRKKLKNGLPTVGTWMQLPSTAVGEILGKAQYDWVVVDLEHGSMDVSQLPDIFRSIELGNSLPLARIATSSLKDAKNALDAGSGGVIVPMIESAQQLKEMVNYCCWPPTGKRGVGFSRANLFGNNFEEYLKEAQHPLIIAQIEHIRAIESLDEIIKTPGLDAVIIGPYDLSASMGITAQFENSRFVAALEGVKIKCAKAGMPMGFHIVTPSEEILREKIKEKYQFIAYSIDSVFLNKAIQNPVVK